MDELCNQAKLKEKRNEVMTQIENNLIDLIRKDISILEAIKDYIDDDENEIKYERESYTLPSLINIYCNLVDIDGSLNNIKVSNFCYKVYEEF